MPKLETRDEILALTRRGMMSVEAAEAWAVENGEIFSGEPDPRGFAPMAEANWTLPMTAAWIVDRSGDTVRRHWDRYRSGWHCWRPCTEDSPDDEIVWGRKLELVGLARLADIFGDLDAFDGEDSRSSLLARPLPRASRHRLQQRRASRGQNLAQELSFALSSGQLGATGILRGRESRSPIPARHFLSNPFRYAEERHQDAIYAVDLDDDIAAKIPYDEIQVPRDAAISIWPPLTPASAESPASSAHEGIPPVKPAATLPPGFDRPDWGVEHVLAWLRHRDLTKIRTLELAASGRPRWYGTTYRNGFVDAHSTNLLREALIAGELIDMNRERSMNRREARWREESLLDSREIWFGRDQVLELWPEYDGQAVPVIGAGRRSESDRKSFGKSNPLQGDQRGNGLSPSKGDDARATPARRQGPRPVKTEAVKAAMRKDIEEKKKTIEGLRDAKQEQLAVEYDASRYTVHKARSEVLSEFVAKSNSNN